MFFFDIETLGVESTTVILSLAIMRVSDPSPKPAEELMSDCLFIKFDASEQIDKYKRTVDKSTVNWWMKQSDYAKKKSFLRNKSIDLPAATGLRYVNEWVKSKPDNINDLIWTRGSLDQMAYDSLCSAVGVEPAFKYASYRDIRTAIDVMYPSSKNGYVDVDSSLCVGYDKLQWIKHDPVHDIAIDAAMLLYGENK